MQENYSRISRRWDREPVKIPISLVLKTRPFRTDDSAVAVDVCLRGAKVRTNLELLPGDWVDVVARGENPRAVTALVVWVRKYESTRSTFAGLELF